VIGVTLPLRTTEQRPRRSQPLLAGTPSVYGVPPDVQGTTGVHARQARPYRSTVTLRLKPPCVYCSSDRCGFVSGSAGVSARAIGSCQPRRMAMNRSPKQSTAPAIAAAEDGRCSIRPMTTTAAPPRAATAYSSVRNTVGTRLGRFHAKPLRTGSKSSWHQRLGDLFTRIAACEEPLSKGEERVEHFAGDRVAALPKGLFPFGKLELFRSRGNRRRALEDRLREAT
jgi:hypothetical protein